MQDTGGDADPDQGGGGLWRGQVGGHQEDEVQVHREQECGQWHSSLV